MSDFHTTFVVDSLHTTASSTEKEKGKTMVDVRVVPHKGDKENRRTYKSIWRFFEGGIV